MKELKEETLGQRIKAQRIRIGMTQEELAEKMNTTKSMISYYENDHGDMKLSLISEFACVLKTSAEYIVCGESNYPFLTKEEQEMIDLYNKMDRKEQEIVLIMMRSVINRA